EAMIASLPADFRRDLDRMTERALVDRSLGIDDADMLDRFAHDLATVARRSAECRAASYALRSRRQVIAQPTRPACGDEIMP
ncbi:hypothetical protein ACE4Z5_27835, partial [Salmonella enterica]|uniref:hypothetical protein n=1 Tax=Salmonella enterica TaxID=28901 RepID=UPI003D2AD38A